MSSPIQHIARAGLSLNYPVTFGNDWHVTTEDGRTVDLYAVWQNAAYHGENVQDAIDEVLRPIRKEPS